jgi:hypothetical protein
MRPAGRQLPIPDIDEHLTNIDDKGALTFPVGILNSGVSLYESE